MKKTIIFTLASIAFTTSLASAKEGGRPLFTNITSTSTVSASATQIFMDINKDGFVGPFERKLFNRVLENKEIKDEVLAKHNLNIAELQKALATSTTLDQVLQYFQAKGIKLSDDDKRDIMKRLNNSASSTLEQAWKRGEISKEQKDRIKNVGENYMQELNRKLTQASSTLQASTSPSFMNKGFVDRVNAFWAKFFRKTATSTNQ